MIQLVLLILLLGQVGDQSPATSRPAADNSPLPGAPARAYEFNLPIVGKHLDALPESFSQRIFGSVASDKALTAHTKYKTKCEWFCLNVNGADVVAFDLTEGRITKVQFIYGKPSADRAKKIATLLQKLTADKKFTMAGIATVASGQDDIHVSFWIGDSVMTFAVDPVDHYLIHHQQPPEVAAAMRTRKVLMHMPIDQLVLMFGSPNSTAEGANGQKSYVWDLEDTESNPNDPIFSDDASPVRGQKQKNVTRVVRVITRNGKVVDFSDSALN